MTFLPACLPSSSHIDSLSCFFSSCSIASLTLLFVMLYCFLHVPLHQTTPFLSVPSHLVTSLCFIFQLFMSHPFPFLYLLMSHPSPHLLFTALHLTCSRSSYHHIPPPSTSFPAVPVHQVHRFSSVSADRVTSRLVCASSSDHILFCFCLLFISHPSLMLLHITSRPSPSASFPPCSRLPHHAPLPSSL